MTSRRVALVSDGAGYVGPHLARALAESGHDIVVGDPEDGLVDDLRAAGAEVATVERTRFLIDPEASDRLVAAALERFGRIDAAACFTGKIVTGRFLSSSLDDLRVALTGCIEAPYNFLRAVVPVMVDQDGGGQVLVFTSASGARPTPGAPLYSSARAGATMLVRNVAAEVAAQNVQVNALGTNFIDFDGFVRASRADTPEGRARVESQVPMGRLGGLDELAHAAMPFLDGRSRFTTGQYISYAGGWV